MKINPGTSPLPPSILGGGVQLSNPTNAGGTQVAQGRATNYSTKSATFNQMNNAVIAADATYHTLPSTGTGNTQSAWTAFAIAYLQTVCGCGSKFANGQACYRMAQMYSQIQGVPPPTAPTAVVPFPLQAIQSLYFFTFPGTGQRTLEMNISAHLYDFYSVWNIGAGLFNPYWITFSSGGTVFFDATVPPWSRLDFRPNASKISYCMWTPDLMPAGGGLTDYFCDP